MNQGGGVTPGGWYPDPAGTSGYRWWDGSGWSSETTEGRGQDGVVARKPVLTSKAAVWAYFPLQALAHAFVMWPLGIVLFFAISDPYFDGGIAVIGTALVVTVVTSITGIVFFLVGLPLRVNARLRRWYVTHGGVFLVGLPFAALVLVLAFFTGSAGVHHYPAAEVNGIPYAATTSYKPDPWILAVGWMLLSFFLLHAWRPLSWRTAAEKARKRELFQVEAGGSARF